MLDATSAGAATPVTTTSPATAAATDAAAAAQTATTTAGGATPPASDAAAGAAAIGTETGTLIAVLTQLIETLNALVAALTQAYGGGPADPGKPGQKDPGGPVQQGGMPDQSSVAGAYGSVAQGAKPIIMPKPGVPGQTTQLPSQGMPGQTTQVGGATGTPSQAAAPTVPAPNFGSLHWFVRQGESGAKEARSVSQSGKVVVVVKDASGGFRLGAGTGREESVPVDGKVMRFDANGAYIRTATLVGPANTSARPPMQAPANPATPANPGGPGTPATPAVPATPPAAGGGGLGAAPPAPVFGALPPGLPTA